MGDLFGVFFGTMVDGKEENPGQNLLGKLVCRSAFIQKFCYAARRDLQHLIQLLNLRWMVKERT